MEQKKPKDIGDLPKLFNDEHKGDKKSLKKELKNRLRTYMLTGRLPKNESNKSKLERRKLQLGTSQLKGTAHELLRKQQSYPKSWRDIAMNAHK